MRSPDAHFWPPRGQLAGWKYKLGHLKKHKPYEIACPQNLSKVEYNALTFIENTIMCKDSLNDANYLLTHLKV